MAGRVNRRSNPPKPVARPYVRDPSLQAVYAAMQEQSALARMVREARVRAQLTQEELAERMGVPLSAIVLLELGKASPGLSTLRRVAKATGTRLELALVPLQAGQRTKAA
jgi:DNA-binding XRE family transcriptional regulator